MGPLCKDLASCPFPEKGMGKTESDTLEIFASNKNLPRSVGSTSTGPEGHVDLLERVTP